jgi:hypothetical protein
LGGRGRTDAHGAIGELRCARSPICVGDTDDRLNADLPACADDPNRNFAAVGNEHPAYVLLRLHK